MIPLKNAQIIEDHHAISVEWEDGQTARFHGFWLYDNALDPDIRSPQNGQRLISVLDIPTGISISAVTVAKADELVVTFAPDDRELSFTSDSLRTNSYDQQPTEQPGWIMPDIEPWGHELENTIPVGDLQTMQSDRAALGAWLGAVQRSGFALLRGLPDKSGALCEVAEMFGYVRETNYGRWFDVRSEINPINLAYTGLGLQAHTDNPYRDPVPTLQLLACMENSAEGGRSIVVDGFKAVDVLRKENPDHFDLLSHYCARFEYAGSPDVRLQSRRPIIELAPDGELIMVRLNNRSIAPLVDIPYDRMTDYYEAYRHITEIIERDSMKVSFRLSEGELFMVDNTRILHSREAFHGTGTRWLQGCYADKDGLLSTLACIEREQKTVAA